MSGQRRLFLELVVGEDDLIEAPVPKKRTKRGPTARTRQMPPSTNVSSPVRGRVRKKSAAKDNVPLGGVSRHGNGYAKDDFVVSDDANETSDDDDGFEPANISRPRTRPAGQRGKRNATLGPPISNDSRLQGASLSELHIDVATSFVHDAKVLEESIRNKHGLRRPLFSENNLREMAIRWTLTLSDMKKIDGINQEAVDRFGKKFLPMIRSYNDQYLEMTNDDDEGQPPSAQSRHADVIDISDDEDEPDDDDFDDEDAEEALMMSSKYFDLAASAAPSRAPADAQSSKVQAWHEDLERLAGQQSQKKRSATPSSGRGSRSGAGRGSRPRGPGGGRKVSRAGAGVTKRAGAMGSRLGSTASGSAGSKGGGPRSVAGGGLFGDRAGKGSGSGSGSGSASAIPLMPY